MKIKDIIVYSGIFILLRALWGFEIAVLIGIVLIVLMLLDDKEIPKPRV